MLKLLGAALLVACGAAFGMSLLRSRRRELELTEAAERLLGLMAGEIELCARPLPELFALLAGKSEGELRSFFARAHEKCLLSGAREVWEDCCGAGILPPSLGEALRPLSAVLGSYDAARQCAEIKLLRRSLDADIARQREGLSSRCRSWPCLGACLAGLAAILLL